MKIGLYDSGIGGISVLKKFLEHYPNHEYIYYGDSARAPYGDKSPEQLISYVHEIFDFMDEQDVQLVISACNTSSMYLEEMNLSKYNFEVICLFDVMKEFFIERQSKTNTIGLLATSTNIDSGRFKEWEANIHPCKCPKLVPLVEANEINLACQELDQYLAQLPEEVEEIILGCTHYPLLIEGSGLDYKFIHSNSSSKNNQEKVFKLIDPAEVMINSSFIKSKDLAKGDKSSSVSFASSGDMSKFMDMVGLFLDSTSKARIIGNIPQHDLK